MQNKTLRALCVAGACLFMALPSCAFEAADDAMVSDESAMDLQSYEEEVEPPETFTSSEIVDSFEVAGEVVEVDTEGRMSTVAGGECRSCFPGWWSFATNLCRATHGGGYYACGLDCFDSCIFGYSAASWSCCINTIR